MAFYHENYSKRAFGRMLNRSKCVIRSFLKSPITYGTKKSPGGPKKLSTRNIRRLNREASKGKLSSRELKNQLELPVSVRRVQQILKANPNLVYKRRKSQPKLTKLHKQKRLKFATSNLQWDSKWDHIVF